MVRKVIKGIGELRKFLTELEPNRVILFLVPAERYKEVNLEILKTTIMLNRFSGIYITVSRPHTAIVELMKEAGIDTSKIFFIDCVSKMFLAPKGIVLAPPTSEMTEDCLYVRSPTSLTEIALGLSQALAGVKNPQNKFVFVDSLSMLLFYNEEPVAIKFLHFLATRIKLFGLVGIIMFMEKKISKEMEGAMTELCDVVAEVRL